MIRNIIRLFFSNLAYIGALLISAGFIVADRTPAPQSIGVALVFLHPFFNGGIRASFRGMFTNLYALAMLLYYALVVLSVFHLGNLHLYSQLLLMQIPLVFIPFGLGMPNALSDKQKETVFTVLICGVILAGLASFVNYIFHYQQIQEEISRSKPIPIVTGVNHIYYSVILAFAAGIVQWRLFVKGLPSKTSRNLHWIALFLIIGILHTVSARTGLFCFYAEAAVSVCWLIFKAKKVLLGLCIAMGLGLLAFLVVKIVPSQRNRMANTELDLHKYESGDNINHYSISMRLQALKSGVKVFEQHPVTGVGPANIADAMDQEYSKENSELIEINRIKPHNEFLYVLVSMGIIGGLALCFMIFLPVFSGTVFRDYLFLMFIVVCLTAFQAEYLLERQVGITFFCLFYAILGIRGQGSGIRGKA